MKNIPHAVWYGLPEFPVNHIVMDSTDYDSVRIVVDNSIAYSVYDAINRTSIASHLEEYIEELNNENY